MPLNPSQEALEYDVSLLAKYIFCLCNPRIDFIIMYMITYAWSRRIVEHYPVASVGRVAAAVGRRRVCGGGGGGGALRWCDDPVSSPPSPPRDRFCLQAAVLFAPSIPSREQQRKRRP